MTCPPAGVMTASELLIPNSELLIPNSVFLQTLVPKTQNNAGSGD